MPHSFPRNPEYEAEERAAELYRNELHRERHKKITRFMGMYGLKSILHVAHGSRLKLLDYPTLPTVDPHLLDKYLEEYKKVENINSTKRGFNNCVHIADTAYKNGTIPGRLHADDRTNNIMGWYNHRLNYDTLPDASILVVDLTAGVNIAGEAREFDVLALRAPRLDISLEQLHELYGGDWYGIP